jgi:RHS repeat-associated protein
MIRCAQKRAERMKQLRSWHLSALKVISEPMSALARTSERDCRTRTTNENCTANESWTRTKLNYDAENCLANAGTTTYTCDAHGIRVQKTIQGGTTTVYVFSGGKDIAEYDNGAAVNSPSREYMYLGGQLAAVMQGTSVTYLHSDHLSVRLSTVGGATNTPNYGKEAGEQGHYPYGEQWYASNSTTKFFFTSYERDPESGNDYAMARFYINRFGRFSCVDPSLGSPSDPQSWNRYVYVRNNPVNITDPTGQFWLFKLFGALIAILGVLLRIPALVQLGLNIAGVGFALPGNLSTSPGTPPTFPDPLGNIQLNSIYNPPDLSKFGINNFTNIECSFNVYVGSSFLLDARGQLTMLKEMRRIFGDAHVGINTVATEQGADFEIGLAVAAALPPGFTIADGAIGGEIPGTKIGIVFLGNLIAENPTASSRQLGTAAGAVASHEIGHKIWKGQGDLKSGGLNDFDIMDHGDPWGKILTFRTDASKADVLNYCKGLHGGGT